jgi:hypothetical protein
VSRYWLAQCEGFEVRVGPSTVGVVREVRPGPVRGDPAALVVRRLRRKLEIPVTRVLEVDPWTETIVVAAESRGPSWTGRWARGLAVLLWRGCTRTAVAAGRACLGTPDHLAQLGASADRRLARWLAEHPRPGQ